jgi:hypothetical protein
VSEDMYPGDCEVCGGSRRGTIAPCVCWFYAKTEGAEIMAEETKADRMIAEFLGVLDDRESEHRKKAGRHEETADEYHKLALTLREAIGSKDDK